MNNETPLSEMCASAPPCGSHAATPKRTLEYYDPIIRRDDSWRELPEKLRGKVHSRRGGLSDFVPYATNGVLIIGFPLGSMQQQVGHLSNLIIEKELRGILIKFLRKQRLERKPREAKAPKIISISVEDLF